MTWSKFDDLYDEHEKIEDAWDAERASIGLHVMATTQCNRLLTDGVVRPRWLERKLPTARERNRVLKVMVDKGLFDVLPAGSTLEVKDSDDESVTIGPFDEDRYLVHDFLERHDSKRQVEERRARDAARKRTGRRKESGGSPAGHRPDSTGSPDVRADAGAQAHSRVPTRPDPTTTPQAPEGAEEGKVVSFARRPVPKPRLELAERLLAIFNEHAGTNHGAYTGRDQASESLRRIIGALTDHPHVDEEQWAAAIRWRMTEPFWEGRPDTGVVFGPRVASANLASAMAPRRSNGATPNPTAAEIEAARQRARQRVQGGGDAA